MLPGNQVKNTMRLVPIEIVRPPAYLGRSIFDREGKIILNKGTPLHGHYLDRLKELGITAVYVEGGSAFMDLDEVAIEGTRIEAVKHMKKALLKFKSGGIPAQKVRSEAGELFDEIILNRCVMGHLIHIMSLRDHTFEHSINVCILSALTGISLGYIRPKLLELGTAALLHDVGKVLVVDRIVGKQEVLPEEEYKIIQKHVTYGYEVLSGTEDISQAVAETALYHHERCNGSGYPKGLTGKAIPEFARIVGIADIYDALCEDRPYRPRLAPGEVINIIRNLQKDDFDRDIARVFVTSITPYALGSTVILNTGCRGVVTYIAGDYPAHPRVQLLYDSKGMPLKGICVVDLRKEPGTFITGVAVEY